MGVLAITPERVIEATNKAHIMWKDQTGEFNHPSVSYSIAVAVSQLFHTSSRARTEEGRAHHEAAKKAVGDCYFRNILPPSKPKTSSNQSVKDELSWPEDDSHDPSDFIYDDYVSP